MKTSNTLNIHYAGPSGEVEVWNDGGLVYLTSEDVRGARTHQTIVRGGPYGMRSLFALDLELLAGACRVAPEGARPIALGARRKKAKLPPGSTFTVRAKFAVLVIRTKPGPGLGDGRRGDNKLL